MTVNFYDSVDDELLKFAVIVARQNDKWVFCKHKERDTYEIPGGHREKSEEILETARRELYEETGAIDFTITPICVYSVVGKTQVNDSGGEMYGMLYYAEIKAFGQLPDLEMEKVLLFKSLPEKLTYPLIQPLLIRKVKSTIFEK
ncbi:MAG: NUDIX domain-containing protein [Clostridiales bacterium]|nr:NUDIX domain-containing protein [Clostridiales bacterium]